MSSPAKRALVVVGAGASVEFGIPATLGFGELIDEAVQSDDYCRYSGGVDTYFEIKRELLKFYKDNKSEAHFERIYHVMHELSQFRLNQGAIPKYRPVMHPFLESSKNHIHPEKALRAASRKMIDFIYSKVSDICGNPKTPLTSMSIFLEALAEKYTPRIYTTNYDDFVFQAAHGRYFTGFTRQHGDHSDFSSSDFWIEWDQPSLFHLHGSIHMGFPRSSNHQIGDIGWYHDRERARKNSSFSGSGTNRMDGTQIERSAIITGLDKLGRLQQPPYAFYYSGLSRDAMEADLILIIGSGLSDLHINTFLKSAQRERPNVPIIYIGYWEGGAEGLYSTVRFGPNDLSLSLLHDLGIDLFRKKERDFGAHNGWTLDPHGKAAIWADGFQSFLSNQETFSDIVALLTK